MNILADINRFIGLFVECLITMGRFSIWKFLLAYTVIVCFILFVLNGFAGFIFNGLVMSWVGLFGEEEAVAFTHYPTKYIFIPYFFGWAKFLIGFLLEGLVLGLVARQYLWEVGTDSQTKDSPDQINWKLWINLSFGWLIVNGLILAITMILPDLTKSFVEGHTRRELMISYLFIPAIYVMVLAIFYYVIPAMIVHGDSLWRAISRSVSLIMRFPINNLFLALAILAGPILVSFATNRADLIVNRFNPELVIWLLAGGLVIEMIANFLWMGTAVRFLLDDEY